MSSMMRRMEIRGMKQRGFKRLKDWRRKKPDGSVIIERGKGGPVVDPHGAIVGRNWPRVSA